MMISVEEYAEIANFLDDSGKVKQYPGKHKKQMIIVDHIFTSIKWDVNRKYSEKEINELIKEWLLILDYPLIRREFIESTYLYRTLDGKEYWVNKEKLL